MRDWQRGPHKIEGRTYWMCVPRDTGENESNGYEIDVPRYDWFRKFNIINFTENVWWPEIQNCASNLISIIRICAYWVHRGGQCLKRARLKSLISKNREIIPVRNCLPYPLSFWRVFLKNGWSRFKGQWSRRIHKFLDQNLVLRPTRVMIGRARLHRFQAVCLPTPTHHILRAIFLLGAVPWANNLIYKNDAQFKNSNSPQFLEIKLCAETEPISDHPRKSVVPRPIPNSVDPFVALARDKRKEAPTEFLIESTDVWALLIGNALSLNRIRLNGLFFFREQNVRLSRENREDEPKSFGWKKKKWSERGFDGKKTRKIGSEIEFSGFTDWAVHCSMNTSQRDVCTPRGQPCSKFLVIFPANLFIDFEEKNR